MRLEYIDYKENLPVEVSLVHIEEYPIHWHKSLEILFVLKGKINVTIESETYEVEEKEIEIINTEEAHRIYSDDKENRVLIFHIDLNFFQKFYDDIKNLFFYVNSSDEGAQRGESYDITRSYLSIVLCELVQRQDDYDEMIEETLIELLYHLINNFHYLMYEKEEIKDNEEQLERYHRIVKYIYNNYNNKISLQDIAKKEFLSAHYLSHEIKNTMGLSFKEFVNLTRVEESIKLLLDTDMTISDISEEIGFSHSRYYNKYFKKHYKLTPKQYRKKYKINEKDLEKIKKIEYFNIKDGLEEVSEYLDDYERYNYEEKIIRLNIDASESIGQFNEAYKQCIYLGHGYDLLKENHKKYIKDIQENIEFEYGKMTRLFSNHLGIFENSKYINFMYMKQITDFLLDINLRPFIVIEKENFDDDNLLYMLKYFIKFFIEEYGAYEFKKWKFQLHKEIDGELKGQIVELFTDQYKLQLVEDLYVEDKSINPIYDTSYMISYIINKAVIKEKQVSFIKAIDLIQRDNNVSNQLFIGDTGIINSFGIKKPSYFAYYFLSKLGDNVVAKGEGYIVTSKGDDLQILLYTHSEELEDLINLEELRKKRGSKNVKEKKYFLNITNLYHDYRMTMYEISEKKGSAFNYWLNLGKPVFIEEDEIKLLSDSAFPYISFKYAKKTNIFHIAPNIDGYGATLILLKKVQKHPF